MTDQTDRGVGVVTVLDGVRVLTAPNAGPMTYTGTQSYILGEKNVAVVDPGPDDPGHIERLVEAVAGERVEAVLVTHSHRDHTSGARAFARRVGAPILAHGDAAGARSATMARLAANTDLGGGDGVDPDFRPDQRIVDGDVISGLSASLVAMHTPGHMSDHLCFDWDDGRAILSGDIVMGWATTLISPPDGDVGAFRSSLSRLRARADGSIFLPGHGSPIADPAGRIDELLKHRDMREKQLLSALQDGSQVIDDLVRFIYADVDCGLWPAARRNVLAHLIDLGERGVVHPTGENWIDGAYTLA